MKTILKIKLLFGASATLFVLFVTTLVWTFYGWNIVLEDQVNKQVQLENGTIQWERFVDLPVPIDFKAHFFDVQNTKEALNGEYPIFIEKGPYIYQEKKHKTILREDPLFDAVTYYQTSKFSFDKEASKGSDDDFVTVINPLLLTIFQKAKGIENMIKPQLDKILGDYADLFIKVKVKTILLDGINFAFSNCSGIVCPVAAKIIRDLAKDLKNVEIITETNGVEYARFSLIRYKLSADGNYTISRGLKNINSLGFITSWNDKIYIENWGTEHPKSDNCSYIHGTDSTLYPPHLQDKKDFTIYNTDICRMVKLFYEGTKTYKGIEGYLFKTNENTLRPATAKKDDDCYCVKETKNEYGIDDCYLDGALDLQACLKSPIILTFPHFLWADENRYRAHLSGINPVEEKHGIYLLVEPNTGTPLEGKKRIQINSVLYPTDQTTYPKAKPRIFPLVWFEEGISLKQEFIDELNQKFFDVKKMAEGVFYSLIALTLFGCVTFGIWGYIKLTHFKN